MMRKWEWIASKFVVLGYDGWAHTSRTLDEAMVRSYKKQHTDEWKVRYDTIDEVYNGLSTDRGKLLYLYGIMTERIGRFCVACVSCETCDGCLVRDECDNIYTPLVNEVSEVLEERYNINIHKERFD